MSRCAARGCKNSVTNNTGGVTFHKFPKDEVLRLQWSKAIGRSRWVANPRSTICSVHFKEEDLDRSSDFCVRIRDNVFPSILPTNLKEITKEEVPQEQNFVYNTRSMRSKKNNVNNLEDGYCNETDSDDRSKIDSDYDGELDNNDVASSESDNRVKNHKIASKSATSRKNQSKRKLLKKKRRIARTSNEKSLEKISSKSLASALEIIRNELMKVKKDLKVKNDTLQMSKRKLEFTEEKLETERKEVRRLRELQRTLQFKELSPVAGLGKLYNCYICDRLLNGDKISLTDYVTEFSKLDFSMKLSHVTGNKFDIGLTNDDYICKKCAALLTHMDALENEFISLKQYIISCLAAKYNLSLSQINNDGIMFKNQDPQVEKAKLPETDPVNSIMLPTQNTNPFDDTIVITSFVENNGNYPTDNIADDMCNIIPDINGMDIDYTSIITANLETPITDVGEFKFNSLQPGAKIYHCDICPFYSDQYKITSAHMRTHASLNYTSGCGLKRKRFESRTKKKVFKCQHCSVMYDSREECIEHISAQHNGGSVTQVVTSDNESHLTGLISLDNLETPNIFSIDDNLSNETLQLQHTIFQTTLKDYYEGSDM